MEILTFGRNVEVDSGGGFVDSIYKVVNERLKTLKHDPRYFEVFLDRKQVHYPKESPPFLKEGMRVKIVKFRFGFQ